MSAVRTAKARTFLWWIKRGVTPASFGEANVTCIKKASTSERPLDHRTIDLLSSDYKDFTKILATWLRPLLPIVVDPAQLRFVPGRIIEMSLNIFASTKAETRTEDALHYYVVLLLDVAKAYDTLQRPFLLAVLIWLGISSKFVQMIAALQQNTTCKFVVNGFLLRRVKMTCGIRQGCPLGSSSIYYLSRLPLQSLLSPTRYSGNPLRSSTQPDPVSGYVIRSYIFAVVVIFPSSLSFMRRLRKYQVLPWKSPSPL